MPNTLAHFGLQAIGSRLIFHRPSCRWVALGCLLPDLPWIGQRLLGIILPTDWLLGLRLYTMIQASLLFSLILAAALTLLLGRNRTIFLILAVNSLFHLLLDALQLKWANGVHLFAPLSWELFNLGLFWPESLPTYFLTALGLLLFMACFPAWGTPPAREQGQSGPGHKKLGWALLLAYLIVPLALFNGPLHKNCHFTATLLDREHRTGRRIEVDRCAYYSDPRPIVHIFTGETLAVCGSLPSGSALLSLQGTFVSADTIQISRYHVHSRLRDLASLVGLAATLILWLPTLINRFQKPRGLT